MIHELKIAPEYFQAVKQGTKTFEVRKNDRNYSVGDILHLMEYNISNDTYTGQFLQVEISYILPGGKHGIAEDYVILGLGQFTQNETSKLNKVGTRTAIVFKKLGEWIQVIIMKTAFNDEYLVIYEHLNHHDVTSSVYTSEGLKERFGINIDLIF